ncbi:hypothetical protein [Luteibacter sp. CQ10]|uniref:hypothetical protein n=1 Tax=Luteibacter sp. CQ10 TaxID=2805821 RepID=UPI0034A1D6B9
MTEQRNTLESGDMYSTAFQFYSHIRAGVDPRTGMYTASVDLSTGTGNALRGPDFGFRLGYSPVETVDDGFGKGWRLSVTELDPAGGMLSLATGDTHKVENLQEGALAWFPDRKLESCRLTMISVAPPRALVEHATGILEYLSVPLGIGSVLRTERIVQANGDALQLTWSVTPAGGVCLSGVEDAEGAKLLAIDHAHPGGPRLDIYSHQEAPLSVVFTLLGERLERITLPTLKAANIQALQDALGLSPSEASGAADDEVQWRFDYETAEGDMVLLTSVITPDGMHEEVFYDMRALRLPAGAPRSEMPAVSRRIRRRLASSALVDESTYSYDAFNQNNFYGYPVVQHWENRSDQLLHLIGQGSFAYGSIETLHDATTKRLTIERTYNQFHLMTREKTVRGSVVAQVDTLYGDEGVPFEQQPANFQLPRRVTTTRYDQSVPDAARAVQVTYVENAYDDMGNILSRHDSSTGITERSGYYPAEGETEDGIVLCPPDPMHLVRRLKYRTVEPGPGGGPIRTTLYRYKALDLAVENADRTHFVQVCGETVRAQDDTGQRELHRTSQTFLEDRGPFHGSLLEASRTQDGKTETRDYDYAIDRATNTLTTVTRHSTYDGIENMSSETVHLISSLTRETTDIAGNRTEYAYDLLGRIAREIGSPDAPEYRVETRWDYLLLATERWVQRTGITGLKHRTWMDEQGHRVRQEEPLADGSLLSTEEAEYDLFGRVVREVRRDDLGGGRLLELTTRYEYDDWGECSRLVAPDGSETRGVTELVRDPASPDAEVLTRIVQWQVYDDGGNERKTGWNATDTDAAERKRATRRGTWTTDGDRLESSCMQWSYDGLGRCVRMADALGQTTRQTWDDYDRLVTTYLPDETMIVRSYAPGHEGELVASLSVTPKGGSERLLGTRQWDGLGRLRQEKAGSLVTTQEYERPSQLTASARSMPNGQRIEMTYDRRLQDVLLSATLVDARGDKAASLTAASYDRRVGLPSNVSSPGHSMDIHTDYLGRMTRQDLSIDGDVPRSSEVAVTPGGRELDKVGVDGVRRVHRYDDKGRLASFADDDGIEVTLAYDALSRLIRRTTVCGDDRTLVEHREYDEHGRVAAHAWAHAEGDDRYRRRLVLSWRKDDKVERKTWFDESRATSELLRVETMAYDARGRLVAHDIEATRDDEFPRDEMGAAYTRQTFEHDCIDNILKVETTLRTGDPNVTDYVYDPVDHDRLIGVKNSREGYPGHGKALVLTYDDNGNLRDDGQGRVLEWDGAGRLSSVTLADGQVIRYVHGPDGRVNQVRTGGKTTFRYRDDGAVAFEASSDESRRYVRTRGGMVAETRLAGALRQTWLLGVDPQGSVVVESAADESTTG